MLIEKANWKYEKITKIAVNLWVALPKIILEVLAIIGIVLVRSLTTILHEVFITRDISQNWASVV